MVAIGTTTPYQFTGFAAGASAQTGTGLNIASGVDFLVLILGLTDNAGTPTSPTLTRTVASGTAPVLTGASFLTVPTTGFYGPTSAWGNWNPFVGVFTSVTVDAVTDFRVTFDTTDAIYGMSIVVMQLSAFGGLSTQWGIYNSTTTDSVTVNLDDGSGSILGDSTNLMIVAMDADPGAVALAAGNTEPFESTTGCGAFIHADPTPTTSIAWGVVTPAAGGGIGVAISLLNAAGAVTGPAGRRRRVMRAAPGLTIR